MEALTRCHIATDEFSLESSPVTGAISLRHISLSSATSIHDTAPLVGASSMVDLDTMIAIPSEVHEEPGDRATTKALIQILPGLSDSPANLREAMRRPDWPEWKAACLEEMNTLRENDTILLATPPAGATIVQALMQFRLKRDEHGEPSRRKARYCARGDLYSAGPDVPIFAPTAPWATVRILLAIAVANDWLVKTFDVAAAFTSVDRTGLPDLWLAAPFGLGYPIGQAFHLLKNLYGFAHSPRAFYDSFTEFLLTLGFVRCAYDKTLFSRTSAAGSLYEHVRG
jgi:hypothetical protein